MANNRDLVAAELARRNGGGGSRNGRSGRGGGRRYQAEEYEEDMGLPDVEDPQIPDILSAARAEAGAEDWGDEDGDEDDGTTDFLREQWGEDGDDDGWDGSTPPRRGNRQQQQSRNQRGGPGRNPQQRQGDPQDFDEESLPESVRAELQQARQLNALYMRDPQRLREMAERRMGGGYGQQPQPYGQQPMSPFGYQQQPGYVPVQPPLQIGQHQITAEEWGDMTVPEKLAWELGHQFQTQLPQQFGRIEQEIQQSNLFRDFHTERIGTILEVIAEEFLGFKLDAADTNVIDRLLDQGYDMKTAVREGYGKRLRQKIQATKKRTPRTPPNRPGGRDRLSPNASLYDVEQYLRTHGRLPDD